MKLVSGGLRPFSDGKMIRNCKSTCRTPSLPPLETKYMYNCTCRPICLPLRSFEVAKNVSDWNILYFKMFFLFSERWIRGRVDEKLHHSTLNVELWPYVKKAQNLPSISFFNDLILGYAWLRIFFDFSLTSRRSYGTRNTFLCDKLSSDFFCWYSRQINYRKRVKIRGRIMKVTKRNHWA